MYMVVRSTYPADRTIWRRVDEWLLNGGVMVRPYWENVLCPDRDLKGLINE